MKRFCSLIIRFLQNDKAKYLALLILGVVSGRLLDIHSIQSSLIVETTPIVD